MQQLKHIIFQDLLNEPRIWIIIVITCSENHDMYDLYVNHNHFNFVLKFDIIWVIINISNVFKIEINSLIFYKYKL